MQTCTVNHIDFIRLLLVNFFLFLISPIRVHMTPEESWCFVLSGSALQGCEGVSVDAGGGVTVAYMQDIMEEICFAWAAATETKSSRKLILSSELRLQAVHISP